MKRFLCALLIAALTLSCTAALATGLTGAEALGLVDTGENSGLSGNYPTLYLGSRDGDDAAAYVVMLQNRLQELGYLSSAADGQYGQLTESAVLAFQEENGLTPTGVADDSTQSILYSSAAKTAPVQEGMQDSDVLLLQQKLVLWGFMSGGADGVMGDTTRTAISEFKEYIYVANAAAYAAYATPQPTPEPTPMPDAQPVAIDTPIEPATEIASASGFDGEITDEVLKFARGEYPFQIYQGLVQAGDKNAEVWRVQRRLRALGYLYKPDGSYGSLTENALKYFQRKNGLKESGVADQATQEKLFSADAVKSEEYIFPYKLGISLDEQRVYVYEWDGSGYNKQIKKFKCSTGMDGYATPSGTYQAGGRITLDEWYYFKDYNCYAKYAYRIVGGILFHSVLYNSNKQGPTNSSVRALGRKASHGCVRLAVDDAKWIYDNCPEGTTVVIR